MPTTKLTCPNCGHSAVRSRIKTMDRVCVHCRHIWKEKPTKGSTKKAPPVPRDS